MNDPRFNSPSGWPGVPPGSPPGPGSFPGLAGARLYPADPGMPGQAAGTSGWAIASFVLGIFGIALLSVIFGIVGLRRIRSTGQRGRGFVIAGFALSAGWSAIVVLAVVIGVMAGPLATQSSRRTISAPGGINPYSLKAGDCFNNPANTTGVVSVALIPCAKAHSAQVFATFRLTGPDFSYPGVATTTRRATKGCTARDSVVDPAKVTKATKLRFIYPGSDQWVTGQRTVICLAVDPRPDLTSSVLTRGPTG